MLRLVSIFTPWGWILLISLIFGGCGAKNSASTAICPVSPSSCDTTSQNRYVYDLMKDLYFWADTTPTVDYASYATPADVLAAMVYSPKDRWSYVTSAAAYTSIFSYGKYLGYGFGVKLGNDGVWRLYIVYPGSPAATAGLRRGFTVTSLNGVSVTQIAAQNLWNQEFGADVAGTQMSVGFIGLDGVAGDVILTKSEITVPPVYDARILYFGGETVGYLSFTMFSNTTSAAVDDAFTRFKQAGIQQLVVDLRYNGGGLLNPAAYIAGRMVDGKAAGSVFSRYRHNRAHRGLDRLVRFYATGPVAAEGRVIFITTPSAASASESLINGLKPFMNVALVGSRTQGKPAGMYGCQFCGNVIAAIAFELENAHGEGGYYDGIGVDCAADDGLTTELGNPAEPSLQAALSYAVNGNCPSAAQKPHAPAVAAPLAGIYREAGAF